MSNPIQSPTVGPKTSADGATVPLRSERMSGLVVQPAHGEMYEAASRGNVYTISTAAAGIAVTAAMVVSVASGNAIVGLFNPTTDTNLHITRAVVVQISGTAVTGGFCWGTIASPTGITSKGVTGLNNKTFLKGGHKAYAFDGSLPATGAAITVPFRYIGGLFPGAITAGNGATFEEVEEDLVVGPGCFAGIFYTASGTNSTVTGSLSWEEVPV